MALLSRNVIKLIKSDKAGLGYLTGALFLAPWKLSGRNMCADATKGCIASCLFTAGHGRYPKVQQYRINRTKWFIQDRKGFLTQLEREIASFVRHCDKRSLRAAVRLNGTSDLPWENLAPHLFKYPVQYYDYTKSYKRMNDFLHGRLPINYHLTFSRSERNEAQCIDILSKGGNVAAVFDVVPAEWYGFTVYDADKTDLRFLDPFGVGGLSMKGKAKHDRTGFVSRGHSSINSLEARNDNLVLSGVL